MGQGPWKHFNLVFVAKHPILSLTFGWKQKKRISRLLRWRQSTTRARASIVLFKTIKDLSQFDETCCDMQHFPPGPSPSLDIYRKWDSNTWSILTSVSVWWESTPRSVWWARAKTKKAVLDPWDAAENFLHTEEYVPIPAILFSGFQDFFIGFQEGKRRFYSITLQTSVLQKTNLVQGHNLYKLASVFTLAYSKTGNGKAIATAVSLLVLSVYKKYFWHRNQNKGQTALSTWPWVI